MIEGRNGMDRIIAYLPETAQTQVAMQILCMNIDTKLRFYLYFIFIHKVSARHSKSQNSCFPRPWLIGFLAGPR